MATTRRATPKSEETRRRILEAALEIFRERGFEGATMREIATRAEVATGAAYYYFDSKEAIVMAFYERAQEELRVALERLLEESGTFEERLRRIVQAKLDYFLPNRKLLGALSAHTDPAHPLSPFSEKTRPGAGAGHRVLCAGGGGVENPAAEGSCAVFAAVAVALPDGDHFVLGV